jgi:hypothetical protein
MMSQRVYSKINGIFLILIGLVFIALSYYAEDPVSEKVEISSSLKSNNKKPVDLVNEHLQKSYDKEVIEKMNIINQNRVLAPNLKDVPEENPLTEDEISSLYGGVNYEDLVRRELSEKNAIEDRNYQNELEAKETEEKEEVQRRYREKYANTFLERARKEGLEVELDEDFKVKSVNKITPTKKSNGVSRNPNRN